MGRRKPKKSIQGVPTDNELDRSAKEPDNSYNFNVSVTRPEEIYKDPLEFYNEDEIRRYAESKSLMRMQEFITKRAVELMDLKPPARVLDIGVGCGFSSMYLFINNFEPVGLDINRAFLLYYNDPHINPVNADMRISPFRSGVFDAILSISAVQWLFTPDDPEERADNLSKFATLCDTALKEGGKLAIQFYPKNDSMMHELGSAFKSLGGYNGGFFIDNPQSPKKRKIYLILEKTWAGSE